jgi:hypothetical protein
MRSFHFLTHALTSFIYLLGWLTSHNHYNNSSLLASKNAVDKIISHHGEAWRRKPEPPSKDAADLSLGNAKAGIAFSLLMPGC